MSNFTCSASHEVQKIFYVFYEMLFDYLKIYRIEMCLWYFWAFRSSYIPTVVYGTLSMYAGTNTTPVEVECQIIWWQRMSIAYIRIYYQWDSVLFCFNYNTFVLNLNFFLKKIQQIKIEWSRVRFPKKLESKTVIEESVTKRAKPNRW